MQVKNVVIVNDFNYVQGGASKVAIETAILLKEKFKVYFFSAVNKKEQDIEGITYISTNQNEAMLEKNKLKGIINGLYNFKAKRKLKKLLLTLDNSNTIIHVHGWTKALSSSVFDIAFKMKFKVILTLHDYFTACPNGGYFNYKQNKICKIKPLSGKCIKCNCDSRNYFYKIYRIIRQIIQNKFIKLNKKIKYAIGISDLNIKVLKGTLNNQTIIKKIYNPINLSTFEKAPIEKNNKYLFIGRITKEKGIDIFCKVISDLGYEGVAIGDGEELNRVKKQYPIIEFVGWKNDEEIKKYLLSARCVVFPSLWYEGAPLTPLESMSYGVPCLVSDNCAGREYYKTNNFKDFKELKDKLIKIHNSKTIKTDFDFLRKFSPEKYRKNLIKFYNKVINNT